MSCGGGGGGQGGGPETLEGDGTSSEKTLEDDLSSEKTFEGDGFSFTYPGDWVEGQFENPPANLVPASVVLLPPEQVESNPTDSLSVAVTTDATAITQDNLADYTDEIAGYVANAYETVLSGPTPATVDGLPAVRVTASGRNSRGEDVHFLFTTVFDGTTWYQIQAEYVHNAAVMKQGYDQAVASFKVG